MRTRVDRLNRFERLAQLQNAEETSASYGITERQLEVLKIMVKGNSNKRISQILNISPETVKEHIRNIFVKLDVDNRMTCAVRAKEIGLDLTD